MAAILYSAILNSDILDSAILLKTLTPTNSIWLKVIHSDSTWWWQPSWIQPFCTTKTSLIDSDSTWWWQPYWILTYWIQPFAQKNFTHFFWLNLMIAAILNSANLNSTILDSTILVFSLKLTHTCQDWFPPFAQKNFTHSFWLNLMIAAILKSAILNSAILYKKYFTHSFWLNLMMAAIKNSAMLDSDIAILDSDTLLSSLRFTQKHSFSTLTLTQTNSIWFKLIHSHLTKWWQPSWILPFWIWPYLIHSS